MAFNRFDMEQQILSCWGILDDINTLTEGVLNRYMTSDEISNVLIGLKDLYGIRFNQLFDAFEEGIDKGAIRQSEDRLMRRQPDRLTSTPS